MKSCILCSNSFYDSSFRKRYCLKLKQVLTGDEAENCQFYFNPQQEDWSIGGEKWKNVK